MNGYYIWQIEGSVPEMYMLSLFIDIYAIGNSSWLVYFSADLNLYCNSTFKTYVTSSIKSPVIFLRYFLKPSLQLNVHQMHAQIGSHVY